MPKQGMKRPSRTHTKPKNDFPPVPEIQGKAKSGKVKANPLMEDIETVCTDLGRDNLENDLPQADIQNIKGD